MYHLFFGLDVPDQRFKGALLENLVRRGHSALPMGEIKAPDGSGRQIDAAFALGDTLVIVECKALGRSLGFERGDRRAIEFRNRKLDGFLRDVDDKARWLAAHPGGPTQAYTLQSFRRIVPVVVTPFAEYIPSLEPRYWLVEDLPRVLTPSELKDALDEGRLQAAAEGGLNTIGLNVS
jgi:hypothetical protein